MYHSLEKQSCTSLYFNSRHQLINGATRDPSSVALYEASIDYELFNPGTGRIRKPLMFYSGPNWLSKKYQEKLIQYVTDGGESGFL